MINHEFFLSLLNYFAAFFPLKLVLGSLEPAAPT